MKRRHSANSLRIAAALLPVLLVAAWVAALSALAGEPPAVQALRIKQKHYFFGNTILTFSRNGLKLVCTDRLHFTLVTKAPEWIVTVYRLDDKTYFQESVAQVRDTGLVSGMLMSFKQQYVLRNAEPTAIQAFGFPVTKLKDNRDMIEFLPRDKTMPPVLSDVIYGVYKQPTCGGMPLVVAGLNSGRDFITGLDETGHMAIQLQTLGMQKVTVPATEFDVPAGFRKAKSITEVVISARGRDESEENFRTMFAPPKSVETTKP